MPRNHFNDPLFVARPQAASLLLNSFIAGGNHARAIYDARRMGKTTFLRQDLTSFAQAKGFFVVYHSFYIPEHEQLRSFFTEIASHIPNPPVKRLIEWVNRKKAGVAVSAQVPPGIGISFAPFAPDAPPETQTQLLSELVAALIKKHPKVLFILDEFQELAKGKPSVVQENAGFIRSFRTILDTNKGSIKTVFAGSNEDLLKELFQNHVQPFYGFAASFELPRFDTDFVEEIAKRLIRQGARRITSDATEYLCSIFVTKFARSPERARLFFQKLQETELSCEEAEVAVLSELPVLKNYSELFEKLSLLQKTILRFLATSETGKGAFGKKAVERFSAEVKTPVKASSVQFALDSLCGKSRIGTKKIISGDSILATAAGGSYYFIDPRFREWMNANLR